MNTSFETTNLLEPLVKVDKLRDGMECTKVDKSSDGNVSLEKVKLSSLSIPTKQDYHPSTHLVHGCLKVSKNGTEFTYWVGETACLRASRVATHAYRIVDSKDNPVAVLSKAWTNSLHSLAYKLVVDNAISTAVVYEVPSLLRKLKSNPARQAYAILPMQSTGDIEESLLSKCHDVCQRQGPAKLSQLSNYEFLHVLGSNPPSSGGLYFGGRGKLASDKNMQIVDSKKRVVWQMSKWESKEYHVDFRAPWSPLQAMAVAIAQYDL